jgi:hypothetical protein
MSVNGFDSISHFLRVSLTVNECSNYENDTPKHDPGLASHFKKCNQWLGPNQPNITTPDFTDGPGKVVRNAQGKVDQPAPKAGERRAPGQLDAPALPGQQDLSKPQVVLPPAVQGLVNKLKQGLGLVQTKNKVEGILNGQALRTQSGGTPSTSQLLDYLLAP